MARAAALAMIAAMAAGGARARTGAQGVDWGLLRQPPNFVASYTRGYDQGRKIAAVRAPQAAAKQAEAERRDAETSRAMARNAEQQRQEKARTAGRMIADGKCQEARTYVLTDGDLDLALQVAKLCPYVP